MAKTFQLNILSPEREFFSGNAVSLVLPVSDGMLGIMAGHSPLTAAIDDGEVIFTAENGEKTVCVVTRGIIDVASEQVTLLCEAALYPDEIDAELERRRIEEAKNELKKKQSKRNFEIWQLSLNKAMNRLKVKSKKDRQH